MIKKIWLSGENGFIGRNLTNHKKFGKMIVNGYNNPYYDYWRNRVPNSEIDIFDPSYEKLVGESNAEMIIHLAVVREGDPNNIIRTNIEGFRRVASVASNLAIPLIYIDDYDENGYFGLKKSVIKSILLLEKVRHLIILPGELYGLNDRKRSISQLIYSSIFEEEKFDIDLDISNKKPFTHMDDFTTGLMALIKKYNHGFDREWAYIGQYESVTTEEVIDYCYEKGWNLDYAIHPDKDPGDFITDEQDERSMKGTGWKPKITWQDGFEDIRQEAIKIVRGEK